MLLWPYTRAKFRVGCKVNFYLSELDNVRYVPLVFIYL